MENRANYESNMMISAHVIADLKRRFSDASMTILDKWEMRGPNSWTAAEDEILDGFGGMMNEAHAVDAFTMDSIDKLAVTQRNKYEKEVEAFVSSLSIGHTPMPNSITDFIEKLTLAIHFNQ